MDSTYATYENENEIKMPKSPDSSTGALKRLLQKCFKHMVTALPVLRECEKNSENIVASLANLIEQRECADRVDKGNVKLLQEFPDLKQRLLSKLSYDVCIKVEALHENLQPLEQQKDFLSKCKEDLWSLLSKHAQGPEYDVLMNGTPTIPPLPMMLDWIDLAERRIRELIYYLDDLAGQDLVTSENLASLWKEDACVVLETLSDCQAHTKYFLEEKT